MGLNKRGSSREGGLTGSVCEGGGEGLMCHSKFVYQLVYGKFYDPWDLCLCSWLFYIYILSRFWRPSKGASEAQDPQNPYCIGIYHWFTGQLGRATTFILWIIFRGRLIVSSRRNTLASVSLMPVQERHSPSVPNLFHLLFILPFLYWKLTKRNLWSRSPAVRSPRVEVKTGREFFLISASAGDVIFFFSFFAKCVSRFSRTRK